MLKRLYALIYDESAGHMYLISHLKNQHFLDSLAWKTLRLVNEDRKARNS